MAVVALGGLLAAPGGPALMAAAAQDVHLRGAAQTLPGLDSLASQSLFRALDYLEIAPAELGFDKLYAEDDTFRLALVERLLTSPLEVPGWQTEQVGALQTEVHSPLALLDRLGRLCEAPGPDRVPPSHWPGVATRGMGEAAEGAGSELDLDLPQPVVDVDLRILGFLRRTGEAEQELHRAFEAWTPQERAQLLTIAPAFWGDAEDPIDIARKGALHFERGLEVDTTLDLGEDFVLDLAARVNREALTRSAQIYLEGLCRFAAMTEGQTWPEAQAEFPGVSGAVIAWHETPWGLLLIGGPGDNTYSPAALSRVAFLIEPGGNDVYRGRIASAVSGITWPFAALIDYQGDDLYDAAGLSYTLGGALMGVSVLVDAAGDDIYRGDDGSLGAGFFGVGLLYDGGGNDYFAGRNLCQGAGAIGMGALVSAAAAQAPPGPDLQPDRAYEAGLHAVPGTGAVPIRYDDNDVYVCARQSQGFASTFGVGLLYDQAGNDVYRAGGRYLHAPLLPHDFQALSQGFSIGFRPRAGGGVGILMDEAGNDMYNGDVYCQGSAYWYSVGLLYDGAGNDRYVATQYSQGAGIHLAVGSLWDRGGDDHYVCKFGVTQGTAHDLSVGWLYDESGNDYYLVSDGQGVSITNSVALFIDASGNDVYATPGVGQGTVTWARGFCGAGIFLDLAGDDTYPAAAAGANGAVWRQNTYGLGIDLDRKIEIPGETIPEILLTAEDSLRAVDELFETAALWEVGSAREKVRRARKALIAKGIAAVDYVVREKIDSKSGLEYRAIQELAEAYPDSFVARVLPLLEQGEGEAAERATRNVIALLWDLKCAAAREPMERLLGKRSYRDHWNHLIGALGRIGDGASAEAIAPFLGDDQERRRLAAVGAIAALKDTTSIPTLVGMLGDEELTVRAAAARAVQRFGASAVDPLCHSLSTIGDERWTDPTDHADRFRRAGHSSHAGSSGLTESSSHAVQAALRAQVLGRVAAALADSTDERSRRARGEARQSLLGLLAEQRDPPSAALRSALVEALMTLGGAETEARVRLWMVDEYDPLVRQTYERSRALGRESSERR
jgi:hypothetical protein